MTKKYSGKAEKGTSYSGDAILIFNKNAPDEPVIFTFSEKNNQTYDFLIVSNISVS